jgi:putative FmdB family regulatory protein
MVVIDELSRRRYRRWAGKRYCGVWREAVSRIFRGVVFTTFISSATAVGVLASSVEINMDQRREQDMPTYEYRCGTCAKGFTIVLTMSEHDRGDIRCPECKSDQVVQQYSTFYAKTSRKS